MNHRKIALTMLVLSICEAKSDYRENRIAHGLNRRETIAGILRGVWAPVACFFRGHDQVDEGFGDPECGCIAIECRRCGYVWPTKWLY